MSNMSYVRFENTYNDLQDCYDHLFDDDLSDEEKEARQELVNLCQHIVDDWEGEE